MDEYIFINVASLLYITHNKYMDDQNAYKYIWNMESKNYCHKKRYSTFMTYVRN